MTDMRDENKVPYVGPRPFGPADKDIFFGREIEIEDIVSLILAHKILIIYAQSGVGKTSVLNAGVIPRLEQEHSTVYTARVKGLPVDDTKKNGNIFVNNSIESMKKDEQPQEGATICSFLEANINNIKGSQDQLVAVIFDQFEEIFTSHLDRWKDREAFFKQICEAAEKIMNLRIIFVIREEFIGRLESFTYLFPNRMRTRYRLERLGEQAAITAIKKPLEKLKYYFEEDVAEQVVSDLLKTRYEIDHGRSTESFGEFIEPLHLQIVCRELGRNLPTNENKISAEHIKQFCEVHDVIVRYFDECIKKTAEAASVDEGELRLWLEQKFIATSGTRSLLSGTDLEGWPMKKRAVDCLEEFHIVTGVSVSNALKVYELSHDIFISAITKSNANWFKNFPVKQGPDYTSGLNLLKRQAHKLALERIYGYLYNEPPSIVLRKFKSTPDEMKADWQTAQTSLASDILDGELDFKSIISNNSYEYYYLEQVWLKDVKLFRAYLAWQNSGRGLQSKERADRDYYNVCEDIRNSLISGPRDSISYFKEVQEYLETHYLTYGRIDDKNKTDAHELIRKKAERLWQTTGNNNENDNWFRAKLYVRMYYENIIPAVIDKNDSNTAMVLKAFQFSKTAENRYLIINCFEAAVAIHFLDKDVINNILENPKLYDFSMIQVSDWPENITIPSECNERFRYEKEDRQIIYEGEMDENILKALQTKLSKEEHKAAVNKLFFQSRLKPLSHMIL